jgi:hypothetical protein
VSLLRDGGGRRRLGRLIGSRSAWNELALQHDHLVAHAQVLIEGDQLCISRYLDGDGQLRHGQPPIVEAASPTRAFRLYAGAAHMLEQALCMRDQPLVRGMAPRLSDLEDGFEQPSRLMKWSEPFVSEELCSHGARFIGSRQKKLLRTIRCRVAPREAAL